MIPGHPDINLEKQLAAGLEALGLQLPAASQHKLLAYLDLLQRWNRRYNLTGVRDPADMVTRHLLDSLAVLPYLRGPRILDVGSGAGLPGIPLAIACPQHRFVLLDAAGKKTRFMLQAVAELEVGNVTVVHDRVESYEPAEKFDTVISRAFSSLKTMLQVTAHLAHADGVFIAMKGRLDEKELAAIPASYVVHDVVRLQVPGLEAARHLICVTRS